MKTQKRFTSKKKINLILINFVSWSMMTNLTCCLKSSVSRVIRLLKEKVHKGLLTYFQNVKVFHWLIKNSQVQILCFGCRKSVILSICKSRTVAFQCQILWVKVHLNWDRLISVVVLICDLGETFLTCLWSRLWTCKVSKVLKISQIGQQSWKTWKRLKFAFVDITNLKIQLSVNWLLCLSLNCLEFVFII